MIENLHPITILLFYLLSACIPVVSGNPFLLFISLICSLFSIKVTGKRTITPKRILGFIILFILIALLNPLFYHDGDTVLFYINSLRFSLEALIYGIKSSLMVISVILWFSGFSGYMTSDKVLLALGNISAKAAIITSMSLHFIPEYIDYSKKYRAHQKLMGIYGDNTFIERLRGELRLFSGMITHSLEHSMTTADSMAARGYGKAKRTSFKSQRIRTVDILLILSMLLLYSLVITCIALGMYEVTYYPRFVLSAITPLGVIGIVIYLCASLSLPVYRLIVWAKQRSNR